MKKAKQYKRKFYPAWDILKESGNPSIRMLTAKWTIEHAEYMLDMHGLDVEQELANILTSEIDASLKWRLK